MSEKIKRLNHFIYIGNILKEIRNDKRDNDRGRQAGLFLRNLGNFVRSRDVPQKEKYICICKVYYLPILTYAEKAWLIKAKEKSRIQACKIKL